MSTKIDHALCRCCALWVANQDDSSCRDYHGHTHPKPGENIATVDSETEPYCGPNTWTCDGCGTLQLPGAAAWSYYTA